MSEMPRPIDLIKLMRPRQWVKSGFVLVGVLFAHAWHDAQTVRIALIAAIAFSLVSSGVYVFNDLTDRGEDALHPRKQNRPLAAGRVTIPAAMVFMAVLLAVGFFLGSTASLTVAYILFAYFVINLAYSLGLKHIVILDVFLIAAGFMLRLLAGTMGIGIAPSQWLLLCGLMLSLFLGFAKRRAELYALSSDGSGGRRVLENYQPVLLDKLIVVTAACAVLSYSLYTTSDKTIQTHHTESLIYTVPFVMYGIFRYIYLLHTHAAGTDPAQEIFRDAHILLSIAGWIVVTVWLIR
jgi:4-hydroxybenzoate polyprenyltransferase